jgi:caa(3)-type oxidase subunit IV
MTEQTHTSKLSYEVVFGALLAALAISLVMGMGAPSGAMVIGIFVIATGKAYLVATRFMHVSVEPRFIKVLVFGALAVLLALYVGLVPDIAWYSAGKETAAP